MPFMTTGMPTRMHQLAQHLGRRRPTTPASRRRAPASRRRRAACRRASTSAGSAGAAPVGTNGATGGRCASSTCAVRTSNGSSRKTGPRTPVLAWRIAVRDQLGQPLRRRSPSPHHLVIERISGSCSISCSAPRAGEAQLGGAAEDHQRRLREQRVGHAGDRVGDAGAGGDDGDARSARQARPRVGGVRGGLLVARVDDVDAFAQTAVIDGRDVAAAEREDALDPCFGERAGDEMTTDADGHVDDLSDLSAERWAGVCGGINGEDARHAGFGLEAQDRHRRRREPQPMIMNQVHSEVMREQRRAAGPRARR